MRSILTGTITIVLAAAAICSTADAQVFTIVNQDHTRSSTLRRVERAVTAQSEQLDHYWHTGQATFGAGGWPIYLEHDYRKAGGALGAHYVTLTRTGNWSCAPGSTTDCVGLDATATLTYTPYAVVGGTDDGINTWSAAFSHEVMETMVDPSADGHEICDPFDYHDYEIDGVYVSAFATPAYFSGAPGRRYVGTRS